MNLTSTLLRGARWAAGALLCAAAMAASAQSYPDKPVRIVVPAPPGGTLDVVARIMSDALQPSLGQPLIVDNKPGGVGMLGVNELLMAPHDGYTVVMHISGIVSEIPHLAKPRYDPFKDIKPLVQLSRSGLVFVGNPKLEANNLKE